MKLISRRYAAILGAAFSIFFSLAVVQAAAFGTANGNVNTGGHAIAVANTEELYTAVNDPLNAGRKIRLSAGIYALSPLDADGLPRPKGGRLELQADMSLIGVWGDRSAVVIEAIGLPAASFAGGTVPYGAIRTGLGRNALEWLTVQNARFGLGNIVTTLDDGNTPHLLVAHVASSGGSYSLNISNFGPLRAGKTMEADIIDNDLSDTAAGLKQGFRIGNFSGANAGTVNARLIGNRIRGNQFNLIINNGTVGSAINVFSFGNRYHDNGAGLLVVGGIGGATDNTITYSGNADRFESNDETPLADQGGLFFVGGDRLATGTLGAVNNTVNATLFANWLTGNAYADLIAIGGRSFRPELISTVTDNRVEVRLIGMPRRPDRVELFADSVPNDPSARNSATVCRGLFRPKCEF